MTTCYADFANHAIDVIDLTDACFLTGHGKHRLCDPV
jgi:hypothetical protein